MSVTETHVKEMLRLYPFMNEVRREHLEPALESAVLVVQPEGKLMWEETEVFEFFPFILRGHSRIYKLAPNGRELHLYSVGPGDGCVLATGSLVNGTPSNARAICEIEQEMIGIPQKSFKRLLGESDVFRDYVLGRFSEQITQLTDLVTAIVFQNLDQRLAASLAAKQSPIRVTHQVLADELGSVREIVSRILKNFESRGWIELQRGQINVLNPQKLAEFSQPV